MESRFYRLFKHRGGCTIPQLSVWCENCVAARHYIALLWNNFSLQIIETGFAEQFYASHRMGPAPICLQISANRAEREICRMILLSTHLFSLWSIPLKYTFYGNATWINFSWIVPLKYSAHASSGLRGFGITISVGGFRIDPWNNAVLFCILILF
jgi:hypothetical protein